MRSGAISFFRPLLSLWLTLALFSCSSMPENVKAVDKMPAIYPDYIGVTIPEGIAPLNFNALDEGVGCMDVVVKGSKGGELHANGEWADFDVDDWHQLTAQNRGGTLTFTVSLEKDGQWTQYEEFKVRLRSDLPSHSTWI